MRISECMTRDVELTDPGKTLRDAARTMFEIDSGILPVGEGDRMIGVITDRDIAIRGIGTGLGPDAKVRDAMSAEVQYCFEDDDSDNVLDNMAKIQVRRLPVVNREKRLVGIVSISDLAAASDAARAAQALCDIARPSSLHSQAA